MRFGFLGMSCEVMWEVRGVVWMCGRRWGFVKGCWYSKIRVKTGRDGVWISGSELGTGWDWDTVYKK